MAPPNFATALDQRLATLIVPPETPPGLQARVSASVAREGVPSSDRTREQLRNQHKQAIADLRRQCVRECAEALAFAACIFLPSWLGAHALSLRLAPVFENASPTLAGMLACILAAIATTEIWVLPGHSIRSLQPLENLQT